MNYHDGSPVALGDIVRVPIPSGEARGRVVMLGDTYEHLHIHRDFLSWVKKDKTLAKDSIVIEWIDANPFKHDDPRYAPVGNYMLTPVDRYVTKQV